MYPELKKGDAFRGSIRKCIAENDSVQFTVVEGVNEIIVLDAIWSEQDSRRKQNLLVRILVDVQKTEFITLTAVAIYDRCDGTGRVIEVPRLQGKEYFGETAFQLTNNGQQMMVETLLADMTLDSTNKGFLLCYASTYTKQ